MEEPESGRRKQALGLTEKHGELHCPGENDVVSSGKGLGNFLDVMALSFNRARVQELETSGM